MKGWSQRDVYACTKLNLSRIESGKHDITLTTVKELCDFYNVSIIAFFDQLCEVMEE